MGFIRVVIFAAFAGLVAYYMYNPIPTGIEQPVLYSTVTSVFRIIEDLGKASQLFGRSEVLVFRRNALDSIVSILPHTEDTDVTVTDTEFGGVPVRVYRPASAGSDALTSGFVYVHGGGYVLGAVKFYDEQMAQVVKDTHVTVVSIEYRLAPEHPSPAAFKDCETASRHFFANAKTWGVDSRKIGIGGDSAGGNMAAALSLKFRDMGGNPQFAYQVLIYPWLQSLDFNLPSYIENAAYNRPDMKSKGMAMYTLGYAGVDRAHAMKLVHNQHVSKATRAKYNAILNTERLGYGKPAGVKEYEVDEQLAAQMEPFLTNPYNFPLMAETVKGVPPGLVLTVGLDTLRDEGLLYADRLKKAGVKVQEYHDEKCWHAAITFSHGPFKFDCGRRLLDATIKYINEAKEKIPGKK